MTQAAKFRTLDGADLSCEVDDFSDPWQPRETVMFLHGLAERADAWRAWVPHFARDMCVVRPDMRGFGNSAPLDANSDWSMAALVRDVAEVAQHLDAPRFHLVSAKYGGTVAMAFAAQHPEMVASLSIVSAPASLKQSLGTALPAWATLVRDQGVSAWAQATMGPRLGSRASPAAVEWWTQMMGATSKSTMLKVFENLADVDVTPVLKHIHCPTLVVTTTQSLLGSVDAVESWSQLIPQSTLAVIDSDSYHVAASQPDACVALVLDFVRRHPILGHASRA
jgi:pimeloyl-ACP methyl ester carboxylesterase